MVRQLLAVADFRRLLAVRVVGQTGDGLLQGALFGAAFFNPDKATSAGAAAVAFAVLLLPYSVVGPFAGVLLDRWSRQRVLAFTNLARAAVVVLLAVGVDTSGATSAVTVALALTAVSLNRFVLSGLSASLPHVVVDRSLVTANSFTTTLGTAAATVGGLASLGLRAVWGRDDQAAGAIALVAGTVYLAAGLLATTVDARRLGPDDPAVHSDVRAAIRDVAKGFVDGVRHLRERPAAAGALLAIAAHRFVSGLAFLIVLLVFTQRGYLHGDLGDLGRTASAAVVGGLVAAVVTPRISRALGTKRWIVSALALAGLTVAVCFPPYRSGWLLGGALVLGFSAQAIKICVDTLVQESIEDSYRGRVFAVYDVLFNVSFVAAAGCGSVFLPDSGYSQPIVLVIAVGYLATAIGYAGWSRLNAEATCQVPAAPS